MHIRAKTVKCKTSQIVKFESIFFNFELFYISSSARCRQGKKLLLGSLACWILFTIPLSFIKPEPVKCIQHNQTGYVLTYTRSKRDLSAFDMVDFNEDSIENFDDVAALTGANTMPQQDEMQEAHTR